MNKSPRSAGAFMINYDFIKPNHPITNPTLIVGDQHTHVMERVQTKCVVPIHYPFTLPMPDYDLIECYFPNAIVFHESVESWVLTGTSFLQSLRSDGHNLLMSFVSTALL